MGTQGLKLLRLTGTSLLVVPVIFWFALASLLLSGGTMAQDFMAQDFEAEDAFLSPAFQVDTNHSGFSGTGFVNYVGEGAVEWIVHDIPEPGTYLASFRYALDRGDRPLHIINGTTEIIGDIISFPATGAWSKWGWAMRELELNQGSNIIRAETNGVSGPNMDLLRLSLPITDNGDGTITDHRTNLMWEKKDAADDIEVLRNPHDADNRYEWSSIGSTNPDGTVFTDFLATLNNTTGLSNEVPFAEYTDWRIPTVWEMQTLLVVPNNTLRNPCPVDPCIIDPIFEPISTDYWSLTSTDGRAWIVDMDLGISVSFNKTEPHTVRAVRGGRGR